VLAAHSPARHVVGRLVTLAARGALNGNRHDRRSRGKLVSPRESLPTGRERPLTDAEQPGRAFPPGAHIGFDVARHLDAPVYQMFSAEANRRRQ
jgi:hypothetical protein